MAKSTTKLNPQDRVILFCTATGIDIARAPTRRWKRRRDLPPGPTRTQFHNGPRPRCPVAKCPRYPVTDPRRFDLLQSGRGWRRSECNSINRNDEISLPTPRAPVLRSMALRTMAPSASSCRPWPSRPRRRWERRSSTLLPTAATSMAKRFWPARKRTLRPPCPYRSSC